MARSTASSNPVSLFPFLAVLMCTIGALVLLLIMITARLRAAAVAERAKQNAPIPAVIEPLEVPDEQPIEPVPPRETAPAPILASAEQLQLLEQLNGRTRELDQELADRQARLRGIEQKSQALQAQLRSVRQQQAELEGRLQQTSASHEDANRRLFELKMEASQIEGLIEDADQLIAEQKKKLASPRYSLVPFDGQTGTVRQPIVIECSAGEIRFVSEGVTLKTRELLEFSPYQNPLLAGTRALFTYWTEVNRASGKNGPSQPYALLLVRPSGGMEYKLARVLLDSIVGNYGYELIDDRFQYVVPPTTDDARRLCRDAVKQSFAAGPEPELAIGPHLERNQEDIFDGPSGPGTRAGKGSGGAATAPRTIDSGRLVHRPPASSNFFESSEFQEHKTGVEIGTRPAPGRFSSGGGSGSGRPGTTGSSSGPGGGSGSPPVGSGTVVTAERTGPRGSTGMRANDASEDRGKGVSNSDSSDSRESGDRTLDGPIAAGDRANEKLTGRDLALAQQLDAARAKLESGQHLLDPASSRHETAGSGSAVEPGPDEKSAGAQGTSRGQGSLSGQAKTGSARRGSASGRSASGSESGASGSGNDSGEETGEVNPLMKGSSREIDSNRELQRRKRWGIDNPSASLGLEKEVTISVSSTRVIVNNRYQVSRTSDRTEVDVVNRTVQALDAVAKQWGKPPERFYWVPAVTLLVPDHPDPVAAAVEKTLRELGAEVLLKTAETTSGSEN